MTINDIIEATIDREGGYQLVDIIGDRGKQTYAGISRRWHPGWKGWGYIDRGGEPPRKMVFDFYKREFWDDIRGDELHSPSIAAAVFDFAVMAGADDARRAAQKACMVEVDGRFGPVSMRALDIITPALFLPRFAIARIEHHLADVKTNPSQMKFLRGWINRAVEGILD